MSLITTSFGAWAGSGVGQPSTDGARRAQKCSTALYGTRAGTKRGGFISQAVRKGCDAGGTRFLVMSQESYCRITCRSPSRRSIV